MKFLSSAKSLVEALAPVARLAPARGKMPILSHMRLGVAGGRLSAWAFDLGAKIETFTAVEDGADGETAVSAARLFEILRSLPKDARVTFDIENNFARIRSGHSRFTLPTLPTSDYPDFPDVPFDVALEVPGAELAHALGMAAAAASKDEHRYFLQGVFLHADRDKLAAVATDGHQMLYYRLEQDAADGFGVIVPLETVGHFVNICENAKTVRLEIARARLKIGAGHIAMTSTVIDAVFPDYRRVMPGEAVVTARFDRLAALAAVRRVAMAVSADRPAIRLRSQDGRLALRGIDENGAEAVDEIEAEIDGEIDIALNHKYLLNALDALGGEMTVFAPQRQGASKFFDPARGDRALAIVMPLAWQDR